MMETPGYFRSSDGTPLYGVFHAPGTSAPIQAKNSKTAVLVAPPLFEERKSAYAALAGLARTLAGAGFPVLRFDYRGSGESGGDPGARRWDDLAADLAAAGKTLAELSGHAGLALTGLRLGATLGILEADRLEAKILVALAPVTKGAAQARAWRMRSKIRAELSALGQTDPDAHAAAVAQAQAPAAVFDLDGFSVSKAFLADLEAIDLLHNPAALECPALLVQISHRTEPAADSRELAGKLGARCELACLRMEPFWDRVDEVDPNPLLHLVLNALQSR